MITAGVTFGGGGSGPPGRPGRDGVGIAGKPGADGESSRIPGPKGETGQGFRWVKTYDAKQIYEPYDVLHYQGDCYTCVRACRGIVPTTKEYWNIVAFQGLRGPNGASGTNGLPGLHWTGPWSIASTYSINDGVSFSGSSYIAILAGVGNEPDTSPLFWNILAQGGSGGGGSTAIISTGDLLTIGSTGQQTRLPVGSTGQVLTVSSTSSTDLVWATPTMGGNGTVTSVGLSLPAVFTVSGSPVTSTGTLSAVFTNESSTFVFAGPPAGSAAAPPTFRNLSTSDISNYPATPGTVTSVDLSMPSIFTVSNNPVTTAGTLTVALNTEASTLVFAGPSTGAAAVPTFRRLSTSDIAGFSGGSGTVTSVALTMPSTLFVSTGGTPITTSGTLTPALVGLATSTHVVFASAASGSGLPTPVFRALAQADINFVLAASKVSTGTFTSVAGDPAITGQGQGWFNSQKLQARLCYVNDGLGDINVGTMSLMLFDLATDETITANTVLADYSNYLLTVADSSAVGSYVGIVGRVIRIKAFLDFEISLLNSFTFNVSYDDNAVATITTSSISGASGTALLDITIITTGTNTVRATWSTVSSNGSVIATTASVKDTTLDETVSSVANILFTVSAASTQVTDTCTIKSMTIEGF